MFPRASRAESTVEAEVVTRFFEASERIAQRSMTIAVVGLGYVGLPLADAFHSAGFTVIGFDVDQRKIDDLDAGTAYLASLGQELYDRLATSDTFSATTEADRLGEADAILVAVPTPLGAHNEPDLSYVESTAAMAGATLRAGQLIVLESTTYPATTRDVFLPAILEASDSSLTPGEDFFVAYSPEREDPGRAMKTSDVPKLVGGLDEDSGSLATALYAAAFDNVIEVSSSEVAEAAKILENVFRAVNIAMVNEMKTVLSAMDIDVWEVIEAAATKPYGFMKFTPGPGLGGHCIPIDPFYLTWKAREVGQPVQFIELAGLVNNSMPRYVVERLIEALNLEVKPLHGSSILVLGLAYKPNVGDTRESPSYEVIELLTRGGADVSYHDPHVLVAEPVRKHDLGLSSIELTADVVAAFDAVVIVTDHDDVDYQLIAEQARIVVDTRNTMADLTVKGRLVTA